MLSTTRRNVLIGISRLAAAAILAPAAGFAGRGATSGDSDLELLAGITYDILPYAELRPELYLKAAQQILDLKDNEMADGLERLRESVHRAAWIDVPEAERVAALSSVQDTPFFRVIRSNTLQVLLREPATFALVGYGGPSIQYGGYLNRGFNDINWLPASSTKQ